MNLRASPRRRSARPLEAHCSPRPFFFRGSVGLNDVQIDKSARFAVNSRYGNRSCSLSLILNNLFLPHTPAEHPATRCPAIWTGSLRQKKIGGGGGPASAILSIALPAKRRRYSPLLSLSCSSEMSEVGRAIYAVCGATVLPPALDHGIRVPPCRGCRDSYTVVRKAARSSVAFEVICAGRVAIRLSEALGAPNPINRFLDEPSRFQ